MAYIPINWKRQRLPEIEMETFKMVHHNDSKTYPIRIMWRKKDRCAERNHFPKWLHAKRIENPIFDSVRKYLFSNTIWFYLEYVNEYTWKRRVSDVLFWRSTSIPTILERCFFYSTWTSPEGIKQYYYRIR